MIATRFGGRTIVLSVVALSLVLFTLTLPWFSVQDSHDSIKNTYTYFLDHSESTSGWNSIMAPSDLSTIVDRMQFVLLAWIPLTLLFIGNVLLDYKILSLVWGWALAILGIGATVYFAISAAPAVGSSLTSSVSMHGLFGSATTTSGEVTWSWGPGLGWYVLLAGSLVILIGAVIRSFVVVTSHKADEPTPEKSES